MTVKELITKLLEFDLNSDVTFVVNADTYAYQKRIKAFSWNMTEFHLESSDLVPKEEYETLQARVRELERELEELKGA